MPLVNAAERARPPAGSAQQDTKLYTPTDGRPVGFDVADVADAVVLIVKGRVESAVLVVEVEVEDWEEEAAADEDVLGGNEVKVLGGIEEEVLRDDEGALEDDEEVLGGEEEVLEGAEEEVLEGEEDVAEDEAAAEVVVVAEEFDDLCW